MKDEKLNIERLFNTTGIDDSIVGDWYIIQWIPDQVALERISVGVAFVKKDKTEHTYKTLSHSQIRFFNKIYGHKASFHIKLMIDVAEDIVDDSMKNHYDDIEKDMINLRIAYGGYASGKSMDEIIDRLFDDIVKKPDM